MSSCFLGGCGGAGGGGVGNARASSSCNRINGKILRRSIQFRIEEGGGEGRVVAGKVMAMRDDVREERRRRIVERGSDRIALITGRRGQNLPSSEPSAEGHACDSSSSSQRDSQILHANDRIRG